MVSWRPNSIEIIMNKLLGGAVDGLVRHGVEEENITAAWSARGI